MAKTPASVEKFMQALDHPLKVEIEAVRSLVKGANASLTEQIKWNAPSYCLDGDDRITLKLHPPRQIQLVFHRGAKVKDASGFSFSDASGLIDWAAADRGLVTIRDLQDLESKRDALVTLVKQWLEATR
ncbi:hypothetical protein D3C72_182550 [compost metagenome]